RSDKNGGMNPFPCVVLHDFADEVTKVFVTPYRPKTRIGWRMLDAAPEKDRPAKQQESARNKVERAFGDSHRAVPRFASALDDSTVRRADRRPNASSSVAARSAVRHGQCRPTTA